MSVIHAGTARVVRLMVAVSLAVMLAACSQNPRPEDVGLAPYGKGGPATPGSMRDFSQNVGDIVYFSTDSTDISPEAQQTLSQQARWLQQYSQYTITIEGHADERGTREYNLGLGERRGNALQGALNAAGASGSQLNVVSYGKERPVCKEHNEGCWSKNRRVEIIYTAK